MASKFELSKDSAVKLMTELGMTTSDQWSKAKIAEKIKGVPRMAAEKRDQLAENEWANGMVETITEALNDNAEIVLSGYDEEAQPEKKKVKVKVKIKKEEEKSEKGKKFKAVEKPPKDTGELKKSVKSGKKTPAKEEKKPKKEKKEKPAAGVPGRTLNNTGEKPGVIANMIEQLTKASKEKPITREKVLANLVKKFPQRSEEAMRVTVVSQLPTRLKKRTDLKVMGDSEKGFWAKKIKPKVEEAAE